MVVAARPAPGRTSPICPSTFQPARQYHSALIARNYDLGNGGVPPDAMQQRVAAAGPRPAHRTARSSSWSPPGSGTSPATRTCGWPPSHHRRWSGWSAGPCSTRRPRRLAGRRGRTGRGRPSSCSTPVAIIASRVFQPDPLMVTAIVGAVLALVVDDDAQTTAQPGGGRPGLAASPCSPRRWPSSTCSRSSLALAWRRAAWRCIRQGRTWMLRGPGHGARSWPTACTARGSTPSWAASRRAHPAAPADHAASSGRAGGRWPPSRCRSGVLAVALAGLIGRGAGPGSSCGALVAGYVGLRAARSPTTTPPTATTTCRSCFVAAVGVGLVFGSLRSSGGARAQELTAGRASALGDGAVVLVVAGVVRQQRSRWCPPGVEPAVTAPGAGGHRAAGRRPGPPRHQARSLLAPADGEPCCASTACVAGTDVARPGDDATGAMQATGHGQPIPAGAGPAVP